jgi:protease-4
MLEAIVGNLSAQMMMRIADDRNVNMVELAMQVDKGLLTGEEALQYNLIDRLDYADILISEIKKNLTGDDQSDAIDLISAGRYVKEHVPATGSSDVALIYVTGTIMDEAGTQGNASGSDIAGFIKDAEKDENIDAIIIRVDSPGGSPSASETIRRAIINAQDKGKKVIVSMGPVAASGGYWIATHADKIIASHGTLTGSIGVVMGKFHARDLWDKVGVNWEGPQMGQNAELWSMNQPFDEAERERITVLIDNTYDAFLTRVAEGRDMTKEEVRQVARGRAWTGEQAKVRGLVDMLGGLETAKDETAKMLGLESGEDINLVRFPAQGGRFEQLLELFGNQVSANPVNVTQRQFYKAIEPYVTQADLFVKSPIAVYDANLDALR